jgi:hypothetical protein
MEKSKRKPDQKIQETEQHAQIEFAAPHSLAECLFRLRDTKYQQNSFMSPGIDPSFEKIDHITYEFRVRRTWYDTRHRMHTSQVEVRGFLRAIDNGTTIVVAKTRISPVTYLLVGLMSLLIVPFACTPGLNPVTLVTTLPILGLIGLFIGMIYTDRRTLIKLLYTTLDGDA